MTHIWFVYFITSSNSERRLILHLFMVPPYKSILKGSGMESGIDVCIGLFSPDPKLRL